MRGHFAARRGMGTGGKDFDAVFQTPSADHDIDYIKKIVTVE